MSSKDEKKQDDANSKEAKRARNRSKAIDELIATEETYCNNLDVFIELFCTPLETQQLIAAKSMPTAFSEMKTIVQLNRHFLLTLKQKKSEDKIGEALMEFAPYFKMYSNYVNNHERSSALLLKLTQNRRSKLCKFLNEAQQKANGQSLQSFLILPIQRIPRYELCLREIIKLTADDHGDLANLTACYEQIQSVNQSINEQVRDFEAREKVRSAESRFEEKLSLVTPSRKYIREGVMTKVCRKKDVPYLFLLFNDLLIYADIKNEKDVHSASALKLHMIIEMDFFFQVSKLNGNRIYGNRCFELFSTRKSFLCVCETEQLRDEWYADIAAQVDAAKHRRLNRQVTEADFRIREKQTYDRILDVAPIWIPDAFTDRCMFDSCNAKFTLTRRKHHCRYCGLVICGSCSSQQLPHFLPEKRKQIVRVCDICYEKYIVYFPDFEAQKEDSIQREERRRDRTDTIASSVFSGGDEDEDRMDLDLKQKYMIPYSPDDGDQVVPDDDYYDEVKVQPTLESVKSESESEDGRTPMGPMEIEIDGYGESTKGGPAGNQKEKQKKKKRKKSSLSKAPEFVVSEAEIAEAVKMTYRAGTVCRIHSMKVDKKYNNKYGRIVGYMRLEESKEINVYRVKVWHKRWKVIKLYKKNVLKVDDLSELDGIEEKKCNVCTKFFFALLLAVLSIAGAAVLYLYYYGIEVVTFDATWYYFVCAACVVLALLCLLTSFFQYLKSKFCCCCCNCCYVQKEDSVCCC